MENQIHYDAAPAGTKTRYALARVREILLELQQQSLAAKVESIQTELNRQRFTLAVVGEFNRGKSTLVNRLLGRELLPVGNMPTTAMLTSIRASAKEAMVYIDEKGNRQRPRPLKQESWEGLVADNFGGPDPKGTVFMGVADPWLAKNRLEILDTPGAGDLEESRARLIGDALLSADGAIIAISALSPMSMSEKLFIQQRLIARKTPYMMLAITKLDEIPESQRQAMITFILNKLSLWELDIPVFVAGDVAVPGGKYDQIIGISKIKACIARWLGDPQRENRTHKWVMGKAASVVSAALDGQNEKLELLEMDRQKRQNAIAEKEKQLESAQEVWEKLRQQMLQRCDACQQALEEKAEDSKATIRERLGFEVMHNGQPERWWREDYPYRMKVELANMAAGLENTVSRIVAEDVRWLNSQMEKCFRTTIAAQKSTVADKSMFKDLGQQEVAFENLDKQRSVVRVATTALSIIGSIAMNALGMGMFSVVATMGVGTGSTIFSEKFFKEKIDRQRSDISKALDECVPQVVDSALSQSRSRLQKVYGDILTAAAEKEETWLQAQKEALAQSNAAESDTAAQVRVNVQRLQDLLEKLT